MCLEWKNASRSSSRSPINPVWTADPNDCSTGMYRWGVLITPWGAHLSILRTTNILACLCRAQLLYKFNVYSAPWWLLPYHTNLKITRNQLELVNLPSHPPHQFSPRVTQSTSKTCKMCLVCYAHWPGYCKGCLCTFIQWVCILMMFYKDSMKGLYCIVCLFAMSYDTIDSFTSINKKEYNKNRTQTYKLQ